MKEAEILYARDTVTVRLLSEIDHHTAKTIREAADKELEDKRPKRLVLDFKDVTFMDSSGIGLILGRANEAQRIGCELSVKGLSPSLSKLVRLAGVEKIKGVKLER